MTFREHLEKVFNKEKGHYNDFCSFEDLICNVCGRIIKNDYENWSETEQEILEDGTTLTFCAKCKELPDRIKLSKKY